MPEYEVLVPEKLLPVFQTDKRYIALHGGRGSAKSWTVAKLLLLRGLEEKKRIFCTREIQNSIKDSVHKLLSNMIADDEVLRRHYKVQETSIYGANRTEFIFRGLYRNLQNIKSTEGIDYCWVEEAQSVSRASLDVLIPTIRKEGSQIFFSYNLIRNEDPVHADFGGTDRDDVLSIEVNYWDNPWFPDVLRKDMEKDKSRDYGKYLHVWCGKPLVMTEASVFKGKVFSEAFEDPRDEDGKILVALDFGVDWGFADDPLVLIRTYDYEDCCYISHEAYGVRVEIDATPSFFDTVPNVRDQWKLVCDSARPEMISHMKNRGFNCIPSVKGKGSVEDGIAYLRGYKKIIVHPRCPNALRELTEYSYKIDKQTNEILPVVEDKNDHVPDALRYAKERRMRVRTLKPTKGSAGRLGL